MLNFHMAHFNIVNIYTEINQGFNHYWWTVESFEDYLFISIDLLIIVSNSSLIIWDNFYKNYVLSQLKDIGSLRNNYCI